MIKRWIVDFLTNDFVVCMLTGECEELFGGSISVCKDAASGAAETCRSNPVCSWRNPCRVLDKGGGNAQGFHL